MFAPSSRIRLRLCILAPALLIGVAFASAADPCCPLPVPTCLEELARLGPCDYERLFRQAELGTLPMGIGRGRLLHLYDRHLPKVKVRMANSVWRGKALGPDGAFVNRWIGGMEFISSCYVVGPSWVDGRPAILMEYAPGTALFANMHDELREIAPGLYMGPVYERFPCPKHRGWVAFQLETCKKPRRCWRR